MSLSVWNPNSTQISFLRSNANHHASESSFFLLMRACWAKIWAVFRYVLLIPLYEVLRYRKLGSIIASKMLVIRAILRELKKVPDCKPPLLMIQTGRIAKKFVILPSDPEDRIIRPIKNWVNSLEKQDQYNTSSFVVSATILFKDETFTRFFTNKRSIHQWSSTGSWNPLASKFKLLKHQGVVTTYDHKEDHLLAESDFLSLRCTKEVIDLW